MTPRELRERWHNASPDDRPDTMTAVDELLAVFAERERVLRERIEALPKYSIDAREWRRMVCLTDVLGVFDDES